MLSRKGYLVDIVNSDVSSLRSELCDEPFPQRLSESARHDHRKCFKLGNSGFLIGYCLHLAPLPELEAAGKLTQ